MISVQGAIECVAAKMPRGGAETIPVLDSLGRVLRLPIVAERSIPPFDRVMMDGIAVSRSAWEKGIRHYPVVGEASAGMPKTMLPEAEVAVAVMTGAVLPTGADLVIPREHYRLAEDWAEVETAFHPPINGFVHREGAEAKAGDSMLLPGHRVDPRMMAVAVSCGALEVTVSRQPKIALVSTGDELVELGKPILPHQIRRSNVHALEAVLREKRYEKVCLHHIPDDPEALTHTLKRIMNDSDCIIVSGGISVGQRDFVPDTLRGLGVTIHFQGVLQRPGKPMLFGTCGRTAIFGLPGNPVSTAVGLRRYVLDALDMWSGANPEPVSKVCLGKDVTFTPPLTYFLPVKSTEYRGSVQPCPVANSGDFAALVGTAGFVEIPAEVEKISAGTELPFFAW